MDNLELEKNTQLSKCSIVSLPRINDDRGSLSFVENRKHIPFDIKRIYYLFNNEPVLERGHHGHKELQQLVIAINGEFVITLDDGYHKKDFKLNSHDVGLYVAPMIWRTLKDFSKDAVCLVLASDFYTEDDYYRNYDDFITVVRGDLSK